MIKVRDAGSLLMTLHKASELNLSGYRSRVEDDLSVCIRNYWQKADIIEILMDYCFFIS